MSNKWGKNCHPNNLLTTSELMRFYSTLDEDCYTENKNSNLLPNLDIGLFKKYLSQPNIRLAIKEFRQQLQK